MPDEIRELPPYRAVLAVDVKNFSGVNGADQHRVTELVPLVLERAFDRAGHSVVWKERRFPAGRGDGFVAGFHPEVLPILLGPVVDSLQDELAYQHRINPNGPRMRVAVGVGPLTDSEEVRFADGSGNAMVETHRLLDSEPLRRMLDDSDPEVTFVAVGITARVYEDVVASGYATRAPSEFLPTDIEVKTYRGQGYLFAPKPSGGLVSPESGEPVAGQADSIDPDRPGRVVNSVTGRVGGHVMQSGDLTLGGDLVLGDVRKNNRNG